MQFSLDVTFNLVFVLALIIVGATITIGAIQGIMRSGVSFAAVVFSGILVLLLGPKINTFLVDHTSMDEWLNMKVEEVMEENLYGITGSGTVKLKENYTLPRNVTMIDGTVYPAGTVIPAGTEIPVSMISVGMTRDEQNQLIDRLPVPSGLKTALQENNNNIVYQRLGVSDFFDFIKAYATKVGMNIFSYLLTFLIVYLIFQGLVLLVDLTDRFPAIHGLNHFAGGALGFLKGILWIELLLLLLIPIASTKFGSSVLAQVDANVFMRGLYQNNIIISVLSKLASISW